MVILFPILQLKKLQVIFDTPNAYFHYLSALKITNTRSHTIYTSSESLAGCDDFKLDFLKKQAQERDLITSLFNPSVFVGKRQSIIFLETLTRNDDDISVRTSSLVGEGFPNLSAV